MTVVRCDILCGTVMIGKSADDHSAAMNRHYRELVPIEFHVLFAERNA